MKVGDHVQWTSQARGSSKVKTGVIVAKAPDLKSGEITPNGSPQSFADIHFPLHKRMFKGIAWEEGGVLVEVRTSQRAKPCLYMPLVKNLIAI